MNAEDAARFLNNFYAKERDKYFLSLDPISEGE